MAHTLTFTGSSAALLTCQEDLERLEIVIQAQFVASRIQTLYLLLVDAVVLGLAFLAYRFAGLTSEVFEIAVIGTALAAIGAIGALTWRLVASRRLLAEVRAQKDQVEELLAGDPAVDRRSGSPVTSEVREEQMTSPREVVQ